MTRRHRANTLTPPGPARDGNRGSRQMALIVVAVAAALVLALLIPAVALIGVLLGFMAAADLV
jgi:hypothetical protein